MKEALVSFCSVFRLITITNITVHMTLKAIKMDQSEKKAAPPLESRLIIRKNPGSRSRFYFSSILHFA